MEQEKYSLYKLSSIGSISSHMINLLWFIYLIFSLDLLVIVWENEIYSVYKWLWIPSHWKYIIVTYIYHFHEVQWIEIGLIKLCAFQLM